MPQAAVERLAFLDGQFELGQPRPALLAEQIAHVRAALQAPDQDRVDLVLHARARLDQLRAAREPAAHHPRALAGHPHAVQRPRGQQLGQRPRVEPVGLGPGLADAGVTGRDHDNARDVWLDDPRDLPRVAGDLQHHPVIGGQALREQLQHIGLGRDPARRAHLAFLGDRDLAEVTVYVQPDRSHHRSLRRPSPTTRENCGQTTPTDPRSQRNQASRRGGHRNLGLSRPSSKAACPRCVLPKAPRTEFPDRNRRPGRSPRAYFHAPRPLKKSISSAAIRSTPKRDVRAADLRAFERRPRQVCCRETDLRIRCRTFSAVSSIRGTFDLVNRRIGST